MLECMKKAKYEATAGRYRISEYVSQRFRLDGGAMFGSVPKVLWEKKIRADELNRIQLVSRILVLESDDRRILIDAGCGHKWTEKQNDIYHFEQSSAEPLGNRIPGVSDIILTHLHFDHAGGVSYYAPDGTLALSYPEATHYVQKENWERAQHPGIRERATYLPENITPLENGKLHLCADGEEIIPGIHVFRADGHTDGLQWVLVEGKLACPSEMMPTAHHVSAPYVMGYDLCASKTIEEKSRFAERAVKENWLVVFGHDAETSAARLCFDESGRCQLASRHQLRGR